MRPRSPKLSYWQGRILHELAFSILMIELREFSTSFIQAQVEDPGPCAEVQEPHDRGGVLRPSLHISYLLSTRPRLEVQKGPKRIFHQLGHTSYSAYEGFEVSVRL